MTRHSLQLTVFLLCLFTSLNAAVRQSNVATGNWTATTTWLGGIVPTIFDDVIIETGHTITIDPLAAGGISSCKSLTVNGKLIYASGASFIVGDYNNRSSAFEVNGTFEFSVGYNFKIYGYLKFNTGSTFKMTSGGMIIDGTLGAGTSVLTGQAHLDVTNIGTLNTNNSTIAIRNPHFDGVTPCIKGAKLFGNTIAFGSGTVPDVNQDFLVSETSKPEFSYVEVNIVNTPTITSRLKVTDIQIFNAVSVLSGTFWNYSSTTPVRVKGDFNVNQGVTILGDFEFNGTGQQNINPQFSSGATLVTFNGNLIVNNPTEVKSKINTTITGGNLIFTLGKFDTELKTLTLDNVPVNANSTRFITTYNVYQDIGFVRIKNLTGNTLFPVGISPPGLPAHYAPVWVNAASGDFKVSVTPFATPPTAYNYVNLKWDVQRTAGSAPANLTFQWNTANEIGAWDGPTCAACVSTNYAGLRCHTAVFHNSGSTWENLTSTVGASSDPTCSVHQKTAFNVNSFSPFAVFASSVLPVELTEFKGKKIGNRALLSWTTASEKGNKGFEIEKRVIARNEATEGSLFETIGFVKSEGDANGATEYSFWDNNFTKTAYYRLKQTDITGKESFSKIISIENETKISTISVFPNPILRGDFLNIQTADTTNADDFNVGIYNANGQLVQHQKGIAPLATTDWLTGIYFVKIVNNVNVSTFKVIKN
jgi:hypothetical protein